MMAVEVWRGGYKEWWSGKRKRGKMLNCTVYKLRKGHCYIKVGSRDKDAQTETNTIADEAKGGLQ